MKKMFATLLVAMALFACKKEHKKGTEQVPPAAFEKEMTADAGQLIDVRTPKEYGEGHLSGARNLHIYDKDFLTRLDSLDKNQTVYVYCKAGGRSAEAVETLEGKGFKHIVELEGGMDAWREAGKPITQ